MKRNDLASTLLCTSALLVMATSASAQVQPRATMLSQSLGSAVLSTLIFGLLGIVLAIIGFKLFDAVISFNLEREICENNNVAVAILAASIVIGVCIIIAATVLS
jgi:uncharacterized membrane protein YjfL (UPF0719 family)